jgi:hypothetical protein
MRFNYTGQFDDIVNVFGLRRCTDKSTSGKLERNIALNVSLDMYYWLRLELTKPWIMQGFDDSEMADGLSDIISCAMSCLDAFYDSVDLSALDTAILLHREALSLRGSTDRNTW